MIRDSLRPRGRVSFWSADPEPRFPKKLRKAGFRTEEIAAKSHKGAKRAVHRIYTAEKPG
jgi:spermidine synthase